MFKLAGGTISWRSYKQYSVTTSTTEAEYIAASLTSKHQVWLQNALSELGYPDIPSALFGDNKGSLDLSENS